MSISYTPSASDALGPAFTGVRYDDPGDQAYIHDYSIVTSKWFLKPVQDELLALIAGSVASSQYRRTYTCASGRAVGDPVYVSAANTVALASSTSLTTSRVVGFISYKPTTTTCYITHFYYKSGLSGLTAGNRVYLDASGVANSTVSIALVGVAISTTEALLYADALSGTISKVFVGDSGAGGVIGLVPAPAAGDAAALKFLKADGTWATTPTSGNTFTTTATAAGTTTLTASSNNVQEFTGVTTQTVVMPVVSTLSLGQQFQIINRSTGNLTVNSSGGNLIETIKANSNSWLTVVLVTGTTAASWDSLLNVNTASTKTQLDYLSTATGTTGTNTTNLVYSTSPTITTPALNGTVTGTGVATAATASTLTQRDANANETANSFIEGYTTTATAAGTTTLVVGSTVLQFFTGVTTQTVKLPVTSTLVTGQKFIIVNLSTGAVTVQSSGSNTIFVQAANTRGEYVCVSTSGTGVASWDGEYTGFNGTSADAVAKFLAAPSGANLNSMLTSQIKVASGGTDNTAFTAYSVICAGTTSTGSFQNVSGVGTSGQVLTSNGASTLPTWQTAAGGDTFLKAYKTADQSISSNTTLAADSHLSVTVAAKVYEFRIHYRLNNAAAVGGFKIDLNGGSAGVTGLEAWGMGVNPGAGSLTASQPNWTGSTLTTTFTSAGATGIELIITGVIEFSGAGTFNPRVAQNVSDAGASLFKKYSHMILHPLN